MEKGKMLVAHRQEIRFADIDALGHVNNAVYLSYFEQARMTWFRKLIEGKWDWETDGIVLARNEVDYLIPVLLNDEVEIRTACEAVGNSSLTLIYEVVRRTSNSDEWKLAARGRSVLVCFDYHQGKSRPVPELWKERLA